jgi:hypothetical protein
VTLFGIGIGVVENPRIAEAISAARGKIPGTDLSPGETEETEYCR